MKAHHVILLCFLCATIPSCTLETRLLKGQTVYHQKQGPPVTVTPLKVTGANVKVNITENPGHLIIEMDETISSPNSITGLQPGTALEPEGARTGWRSLVPSNKLYFPENQELDAPPKRLLYSTGRPVLQSMTIALKIRPELDDSLPSQTETGFNLAIAYGQKFEINSFRMRKNIFGEQVNRYSLSFGLFAGPSATDLKASNTTDPTIRYDRKAVLVSSGGFLMFGVNRLHIGYTLGVDFATGRSAQSWIYQGRPWHGIALAFDLLK